jgi:hypothetical protein
MKNHMLLDRADHYSLTFVEYSKPFFKKPIAVTVAQYSWRDIESVDDLATVVTEAVIKQQFSGFSINDTRKYVSHGADGAAHDILVAIVSTATYEAIKYIFRTVAEKARRKPSNIDSDVPVPNTRDLERESSRAKYYIREFLQDESALTVTDLQESQTELKLYISSEHNVNYLATISFEGENYIRVEKLKRKKRRTSS